MVEHEIRWENKCIGVSVQTYLYITESPCSVISLKEVANISLTKPGIKVGRRMTVDKLIYISKTFTEPDYMQLPDALRTNL